MKKGVLLFFALLFAAASAAGGYYLYKNHIRIPTTGFAGLDKWREKRVGVYLNDFGELTRYRSDNQRIKETQAKVDAVFFGDSIMDYWDLKQSFPGKAYISRGISGQTTSQMLVRFQQDVVELKPQVVVILASNNDLAGITGPMQVEDIMANYASLAAIAKDNNITVIFISMLPLHDYTPESKEYFSQRPLERIREINTELKAFAASRGIPYVNAHSVLLDDSGKLKAEYAQDGLHPNTAGYAAIVPLVDAALASAFSARNTTTRENRRSVAD